MNRENDTHDTPQGVPTDRKPPNTFLAFPERLREGVIVARPNRFIMDVAFAAEKTCSGETAEGTPDAGAGAPRKTTGASADIPAGSGIEAACAEHATGGGGSSTGSSIVRCHCPAVSRIGGLDLAGRPCLVSDSHNPKRKMPLTVEAFSLQQPGDAEKRWIGIDQNASNRYVEHFLRAGALGDVTGPVESVARERPLGGSRLDFLVNDDLYLEVKTPLVQMQTGVPPYVPRLPEAPFSSTERAMRHLRELAGSLSRNERAVILYCLYYDNTGFRYYHGTTYDEVMATVAECRAAGVELWQADFAVTPEGVEFKRAFQLEEW